MYDDLPDPEGDEPERSELDALLRDDGLKGVITRNLMLKALQKGLLESEEGEAANGLLSAFSAEERSALFKDIVHDSWSHATLGAVTALCAHHLTEIEVAALVAAAGSLYVLLKNGKKHHAMAKERVKKVKDQSLPSHYNF